MDQPDAQVAGNVGAGEYGHHARLGLCPAGVDGYHVGPGMLGQMHRAVEHSRRGHVVDVELVAHCQLGGLVAGGAGSHAPDDLDRGAVGSGQPVGAGGQHVDRVEDLQIARAAAQVGAEMAGGLLAGEAGALVVDQGLDPHHYPRGAEATLHRSGGPECGRVAMALLVAEALGRDDLRALSLLERDLARHPGLAVEEHRAAAALARR